MNKPLFIVLGKILKPHGLKGWVKLQSFTENPEDIFSYGPFFLQNPEDKKEDQEYLPFSFQKERSLGGDFFLISSPQITNRTEGEKIQHFFLVLNRKNLKENTPEQKEEWYYVDLIGREIYDSLGVFLGLVTNVVSYGAGDILVFDNHMVSFSLVESITAERIVLKISKETL